MPSVNPLIKMKILDAVKQVLEKDDSSKLVIADAQKQIRVHLSNTRASSKMISQIVYQYFKIPREQRSGRGKYRVYVGLAYKKCITDESLVPKGSRRTTISKDKSEADKKN